MKTQEEFGAAEALWRAQLAGRSLVIESNADVTQAKQALALLGSNFRHHTDLRKRQALLRDYRAAFLVGTCAVAATTYELGAFWPHFEAEFGAIYQDDRAMIADAFRDALDSFGLSRFTFPRRNVDEIMMHAGIPGARSDEFMALLQKRDAMVDGLDGRQFCQWVAGMSRNTASTYGLDAPTWRFLGEGREIAEDLVDRCLELLDKWAAGGVSEADVSAFPSVMQKDLLRALDELSVPINRAGQGSRRKIELAPKLMFDLTSGINLRLPSLEYVLEKQVVWTIASDGSTTRLTAEPPWPGDPVTEHRHVVSRPVKQVALTAMPSESTWLVNVVDPDEPMLIFDALSGEWIPPRNSLPKADVVLAVPNPDGQPLDKLIEMEGEGRSELLDAPLGWGMWSFARLTLGDVTKVREVGADRWRYVSTVTRPQVEPRGVIPWATALDGSAVCSRLPAVRIPAAVGVDGVASALEWTITISRADENKAILSRTVSSSESSRVVELDWHDADATIGVFDFKISGPLGRGASRRLTVIDGLEVTPSVLFRPMSETGDGLLKATIQVAHSRSGGEELALTSSQTMLTHQLVAGGTTVSIRVGVPVMSVVAVKREERTPSHSPVHLDLEDLALTSIRVATGTTGRTTLVAMQGDRLLQTIEAAAIGSTGAVTFNVAQLSDTLIRTGGASLLIGHDGSRIPVARVRPRELLQEAAFVGGSLHLIGLAAAPLEIAFYRRYAPWLPPVSIRTDGGDIVAVPAELLGEGDLRLVITIEDPWVPRVWPLDYPSRGINIFDLAVGDLQDNRGGADNGYRAWLKRTYPCPQSVESLPLAISLYAGTALSKYRTPMRELQIELARAVSASAAHFFTALPGAAVESVPIDLLVAADVIQVPPSEYPSGADLWDVSPVLAVLSHDWSGGVSEGTRDELVRVLGAAAQRILDDGVDPLAAVGRFGSNAELMARWPPDRVDVAWRSVDPVPGRLLDGPSRQIAAKELFDGRHLVEFDLAKQAAALPAIKRVLMTEYGPESFGPIEARVANQGWTSLPALTIAFSLVARSAARGVPPAMLLHEATKPYLEGLARQSPKFVEQDLILAELWITRWSTRDDA